jgi:hypothetical protein
VIDFIPAVRWLRGLVAAFIGGGASAVTSSITAAVIAPDKFNATTQLHSLLILMGTTFCASGAMSVMFYLKQAPLPDWDGVTDRRTIAPQENV